MNGIEVRNLTKRYGQNWALNDVSLTFEEGKIYGLLGRNGAGKTTLLNTITGRIFPTSGQTLLNGATTTENDDALRNIYMLSEQTLYPEKMRVYQAFRWSAQFYPNFSEDYAHALAERFGLEPGYAVSSLSTGYDTIFKLVVALACGAPYLLLDEPVLGLDANHRDLFYKAMLERYTETPCCIVLSTHLVEEVSNLVEDVVIINKGRLVKNEPRDSLLACGYTVTGSVAGVDAYTAGRTLLGSDTIGGLKTAYVYEEAPPEPTPGLEFSALNLQRLFIQLTNDQV